MTRHDALSCRLPTLVHAWCARHYGALAVCVLGLAAINLGARLDREVVTEWDEALYAMTAWEAVEHGHWIGTTFLGDLDYYNSKPPLNVWLIGGAFTLFGPDLLSLRLASAFSSWMTIAILLEWGRRRFGPLIGLVSALVLSTAFGFLYVHSGRSGNPDAHLTLLVLLTVVTLSAAPSRPWIRLWLGPIAAGVFLLKGAAVVLPVLIVALVEWQGRHKRRARPAHFAAATVLFLVPTLAWAVARWRVDGMLFFENMFQNDLIAISLRALDGHDGGPFFYLHTLQKNQLEWLVAALVALCLVPPTWAGVQAAWRTIRTDETWPVIAGWALVVVLVPTAMQTKLSWYLNPFYPVFALGVALILARTLSPRHPTARARLVTVWTIATLALVVTEARLIAYSYRARDIEGHAQGLLLAAKSDAHGRRVFRDRWDHADLFVLRSIRADAAIAAGLDDFLNESTAGDYFVSDRGLTHPALLQVRANKQLALYARRQETSSMSD